MQRTNRQAIFTITNNTTDQHICRFGFDAARRSVSDYPANELARLQTHFYHNWRVSTDPAHPNGMEYVQMVRIKQWKSENGKRVLVSATAPYATPYTYTVRSGWNAVRDAVQNNPGSLWLIGNEIERRDWTTSNGGSTGQDEILPEVYAWAYHDLYTAIKGWDPTARVSAGGIIQATPLRLQYLDRVWNEYLRRYRQQMPVDVWNIHAFVLQEKRHDWGADIPAGIDVSTGELYTAEDNKDFRIAAGHIRAFRQWMREKGEQDKPLFISEYGVNIPWYSPEVVRDDFMYPSFDFFLNEKDTNVGYPADGYRLVQKWSWYSLDDDVLCSQTGQLCFNGHLFYSGLNEGQPMGIAPLGRYWESYVTNPISVPLYVDLSPVRVWQDVASSSSSTVTVTLHIEISNNGNTDITQPFTIDVRDKAMGTLIASHTVSALPGCGNTVDISVTWPDLTPGTHSAWVFVDARNNIAESNEINNLLLNTVLAPRDNIFLPVVMKNML